MARNDIIVEFIGVPGAGKTVLASALAQDLSGNFDVALPDRSAYRRKELTFLEKIRLDVLYAPRLLLYRIRRVSYDMRNVGLGLWTVGNSWEQSRYPIVLLDLARLAPRQFYILDEWVMHRIIDESIRRYHSSVAFSRSFAIPPVRTHCLVYVCVNVDRELALERIFNQDQPFRVFAKKTDRPIIDEILAVWGRQVEQLKSEIERRHIHCIDIDGSAPIASNVELLRDRLLEFSRRLATGSSTRVKQQ